MTNEGELLEQLHEVFWSQLRSPGAFRTTSAERARVARVVPAECAPECDLDGFLLALLRSVGARVVVRSETAVRVIPPPSATQHRLSLRGRVILSPTREEVVYGPCRLVWTPPQVEPGIDQLGTQTIDSLRARRVAPTIAGPFDATLDRLCCKTIA